MVPVTRPFPSVWQRTLFALSAMGMALLTGACSLSAPLGALEAGADDAGSSSGNEAADLISALSTGALRGDDIITASRAAERLLPHGMGGPWENPQTGARGAISPIAAPYRDNGRECRDFLVSYVHDEAEAWMQGEACHNGNGQWEVHSLRPWRR